MSGLAMHRSSARPGHRVFGAYTRIHMPPGGLCRNFARSNHNLERQDAKLECTERLDYRADMDAIIHADRSETIQRWNAAAEVLFGHSAPEAIGGNLDLIIPERLGAAHW